MIPITTLTLSPDQVGTVPDNSRSPVSELLLPLDVAPISASPRNGRWCVKMGVLAKKTAKRGVLRVNFYPVLQ